MIHQYETVGDAAESLVKYLGSDFVQKYNLFFHEDDLSYVSSLKIRNQYVPELGCHDHFIMLSDAIKEKWNVLPWAFSELLNNDYTFLCEMEDSFDDVSPELFSIIPDNAEFLYSLEYISPDDIIVRLEFRLPDTVFEISHDGKRMTNLEPWFFSKYNLSYHRMNAIELHKGYHSDEIKWQDFMLELNKKSGYESDLSGDEVLNRIKERKLIHDSKKD